MGWAANLDQPEAVIVLPAGMAGAARAARHRPSTDSPLSRIDTPARGAGVAQPLERTGVPAVARKPQPPHLRQELSSVWPGGATMHQVDGVVGQLMKQRPPRLLRPIKGKVAPG